MKKYAMVLVGVFFGVLSAVSAFATTTGTDLTGGAVDWAAAAQNVIATAMPAVVGMSAVLVLSIGIGLMVKYAKKMR